ncbi:sorbosone dehydrogenase family protein [Chitinophaga varians]|uniref:Sorbosone dehydrogenase family protein n=1 Tax=Chitinophaga varians TaxID=2202339 RepID=A0A847R6L8_9BACT|nr:sorbosone dehydrogenase family protein [Chitinophaga varians]NLR62769.1 sorbosone dehydrogenase family protein [Chitinophaga varians]
MKVTHRLLLWSLLWTACHASKLNPGSYGGSATTKGYRADSLPAPYATPSAMNYSRVIGWTNGQTPVAPAGFTVTRFADGLDHPRWLYVADNGDVFVAESNKILKGIKKAGAKISRKIKTQHYGESANRITLLRDTNKDGYAEQHYLLRKDLNQPFGMLVSGDHFYVGNTDALMRFSYHTGDTIIRDTGVKLLSLPAGEHNQHWTRSLLQDPSGRKLYIGVGAGTNVAEKGLDNEVGRACILEVNMDGSGEHVYASGLRNPVGMDWAPGTHQLWAAVNERDELGDELVPDYLTAVQPGGFYGWPFYYYGSHPEPRMEKEMAMAPRQPVITPDVPLGSHTASLGLLFYRGKSFPSKYHHGAFITQHGSWNRSVISGYKVVFVPFQNGRPAGPPEDFLTGFVANQTQSEVHGRPVGIAMLPDGDLLITDDVSNVIWRIHHH